MTKPRKQIDLAKLDNRIREIFKDSDREADAEILRRCGLDPQLWFNVLDGTSLPVDLGEPEPKRGYASIAERDEHIRELRGRGWTTQQLMAHFELSESTIRRIYSPGYARRNVEANRTRKRHGRQELPPITCVICSASVIPTRIDQRTCLSPACQRILGDRGKYC